MGVLNLYVCACLAVVIQAIEIPQYLYQEVEDRAAALHKKPPIPIVKQSFEQSKDGYQFSYETGNGIHAEESGYIKNKGDKKHEILVQQGTVTYHDDHGNPITLTYVADEKGFRPQGSHLPTPPPIPDEILKSLEFNAKHAEEDEQSQYAEQAQQAQYAEHTQRAQYAEHTQRAQYAEQIQQAQPEVQQEYQYQEQEATEEEYDNSHQQQQLLLQASQQQQQQHQVLQREYQKQVQQQIQKQLQKPQYIKQQYQPQEYQHQGY